MSNDDKCRLIAEFERVGMGLIPQGAVEGEDPPDYAHDLNATMRAARRLPDHASLIVEASFRGGEAWINDMGGEGKHIANHAPAQAACDALAEWISAHPNDQG